MGDRYDDEDKPAILQSTGNPARSFVIRIWIEYDNGHSFKLRGTLYELGGRAIGAFDSIPALALLLDRALLPPVDPFKAQ